MKTSELMNDTQILEEVAKIQYLYKLKYEIRYDLTREETLSTESVAEHIYGMFILAHYFLPLEDPESTWNRQRIYEMILWHDIDEIETGDIMGYKKTELDRANERIASQKVIEKMPEILQASVTAYLHEYEARETIESRFVKAIDKMECDFHILNENGKKIQRHNNTTLDEHLRIKEPYLKDFPIIKKFGQVMTDEMVKREFFVS